MAFNNRAILKIIMFSSDRGRGIRKVKMLSTFVADSQLELPGIYGLQSQRQKCLWY